MNDQEIFSRDPITRCRVRSSSFIHGGVDGSDARSGSRVFCSSKQNQWSYGCLDRNDSFQRHQDISGLPLSTCRQAIPQALNDPQSQKSGEEARNLQSKPCLHFAPSRITSSISAPLGAFVKFSKPLQVIRISSSILTPPTCIYRSRTDLLMMAEKAGFGR